ncbi:hypothetical protein [Rhodohalobacter barkolensis]|uniref:Uncharacterized protein n=1 Tax=Rhodohalobacter barkolensis TaxID=2053187 RepID=A0A2N0VH17_9BACT|nr:hypothetical protein [Rhodohalobacter barkolensis]PKD43486.1 hypothetical protein CWD77_07900 [Rhodohalobacter barkolensis]
MWFWENKWRMIYLHWNFIRIKRLVELKRILCEGLTSIIAFSWGTLVDRYTLEQPETDGCSVKIRQSADQYN